MSLDQFDDLLGGDEEEELEPAPFGRDFSLHMGKLHEIQRGVTEPWLCQAFTLPRPVVRARLKECPLMRRGKNGTPIYDLRIAAAYLVKPRISIKEYIESIEPKDLPQTLQREFWAAKLSEQRWRRQAGELWASEDVVAVFGEVFKLIKNKTRLWQNSISSVEAMSQTQTDELQNLVEDLLDKIYQTLTALESGSATASQLAEVDEDAEEIE